MFWQSLNTFTACSRPPEVKAPHPRATRHCQMRWWETRKRARSTLRRSAAVAIRRLAILPGSVRKSRKPRPCRTIGWLGAKEADAAVVTVVAADRPEPAHRPV